MSKLLNEIDVVRQSLPYFDSETIKSALLQSLAYLQNGLTVLPKSLCKFVYFTSDLAYNTDGNLVGFPSVTFRQIAPLVLETTIPDFLYDNSNNLIKEYIYRPVLQQSQIPTIESISLLIEKFSVDLDLTETKPAVKAYSYLGAEIVEIDENSIPDFWFLDGIFIWRWQTIYDLLSTIGERQKEFLNARVRLTEATRQFKARYTNPNLQFKRAVI